MTQTQRKAPLVERLRESYPHQASFRAVVPRRTAFPKNVLLLPLDRRDRETIADAVDLPVDELPSARPVSRWTPETSDDEEHPRVFRDCPFRLSPTGKVIEVLPPNWLQIIRSGAARSVLALTFDLRFERGDRGWSAFHPETGQLIRPSVVKGLEIEVTDEKFVFKPGEVMLLLLLARTFILAVPPGIVDQIDTGGIDLYVANEGTDWRMMTAMPMWGHSIDPFDMYGTPDLADIWRLDTASAGFNLIAEVQTIVEKGLRGGEGLFTLVKSHLHPESIHRNREIPLALRPVVEELGREFYTAVAVNSDAIQRWLADRLQSELRRFQAIRYQVRQEDLKRLIPAHPKGKRLTKPLAAMTFAELTRMLWKAVLVRAAQRSIEVPEALLKNPPASWRDKSASKRSRRRGEETKAEAKPQGAKGRTTAKGGKSDHVPTKPGRIYVDERGEGTSQSADRLRDQIARLKASGKPKDLEQAKKLEAMLPKIKTRLADCTQCGKRHRVPAEIQGDLKKCPKKAKAA